MVESLSKETATTYTLLRAYLHIIQENKTNIFYTNISTVTFKYCNWGPIRSTLLYTSYNTYKHLLLINRESISAWNTLIQFPLGTHIEVISSPPSVMYSVLRL